jgi:hypothetical protein
VDAFGLSYFDDWMELVVTHELTHVFHLDVTGALGRVLRALVRAAARVVARLPRARRRRAGWSRGLAVYYETALSQSGRGEGTYHDMVIRTAALEGRLESIDQASGESPVWPAGERVYIYGSTFFEWLLARGTAPRGCPSSSRPSAASGFRTVSNSAGQARVRRLVLRRMARLDGGRGPPQRQHARRARWRRAAHAYRADHARRALHGRAADLARRSRARVSRAGTA